MNAFILSLMILLAGSLQANKEMLDALTTIEREFDIGYGPAEWKKTTSGWDLQDEMDKVREKVLATPDISIRQFQDNLLGFFRSTHDYHVGLRLLTSEWSELGFMVRSAEGRVFVVDIDRDLLGETSFPFSEGDELVTLGGVPVGEVIADLRVKTGMEGANDQTEVREAEDALTFRRRSSGHPCEKGAVTVGIRPKGASEVQECQLIWNYNEETVRTQPPAKRSNPTRERLQVEGVAGHYHYDRHSCGGCPEDESAWELGSRASLVPPLGVELWNAGRDLENGITASIYLAEDGKKIGMLRLHQFYGSHWSRAKDGWQEYAAVIKYLEENSDVLVLDQQNNPGGSVLLCFSLLSMLSDQPLMLPKEASKLDLEEVYDSRNSIKELSELTTDEEVAEWWVQAPPLNKYDEWQGIPHISGIPMDLQLVKKWIHSMQEEVNDWDAGLRMTHPIHYFGLDKINPSPFATYTKPILCLINEWDFSCGDMFPAVLQDNGRATLMGVRTAGAGGHVLGTSFRNSLGLYYYRYTGGLGERVNGGTIEDLGVIPDINYELTANDIQESFEDFKSAILRAVDALFGGKD